MDVIYLDHSKAFDTVPHKRLIKKLAGYNISGNVLRWISEFLNNRTQRVFVQNCYSEWAKVTSGVPQGSVLGPVLLALYVNEIPDLVKSTMKMYADDSKLFGKASTEADTLQIQEDLDVLSKWSEKWLLKFNVSKCKVMHCGRQNPMVKYHMKQTNGVNMEIEVTELEKDLGIYVSNTLMASINCARVANKAMGALRQLRISFDRLTVENFKPLFTTYVRPHLEHCLQATGPYMKRDLKMLEKGPKKGYKDCARTSGQTI